MAELIPKVFHRIFLDEPVPAKFEAFWDRFRELHPAWEFVTWSDSSELDWIRNRALFDQCTTHAGRADVLRFEIMASYGGVYVDTDVEPLRAFDSLLESDEPFAGWEKRGLLCPTVLGGPPAHPAFDAVVGMLPDWARKFPPDKPNLQTGPRPFTHAWRWRSDVRTLPREAFYPVGWWERDQLGGPYPPESFCVHHWEQSWDPAAKTQIDSRQVRV